MGERACRYSCWNKRQISSEVISVPLASVTFCTAWLNSICSRRGNAMS